MPGPIVVIGSINMDLVCRVERMPRPGETLTGEHFMTVPGGKGANQAVATAKLAGPGQPVHLLGRVGDDDFGQRLLNGLRQHNVNIQRITVTEGVSTGTAMILVDHRGENSIVVSPGANGLLRPRDLDAAEQLIQSASVVVLQLEIPHETVRHALTMCRRHGIFTILDPSPVPDEKHPLVRAMYGVDLFAPNQIEAETLLGMDPKRHVKKKRVEDPKLIVADLLARGAKCVVLKLGAKGCLGGGNGMPMALVKAFKVKVVDTTASGDAFNAALAVAHAEQMRSADALRFANAAGALACTSFGAQPSLPARDAVDRLLKRSAR